MKKEKKIKRSICTVLALGIMAAALCITMISCGGSKTEETSGKETAVSATTVEMDDKKEQKTEPEIMTNADDTQDNVKSADKSKQKTDPNTEIQKSTQKNTQTSTQATTQTKRVCYISVEGYCSNMEISLQGGDTAYSVLCRSGAAVSGSSSYVKGINGRFEFDEGPSSGWVYYLNGSKPSVGCGSCSVKAGDSIKWDYVTSY